MKILVMGARAVDCFYGGKLAHAGHELIVWVKSYDIEKAAELLRPAVGPEAFSLKPISLNVPVSQR